MNRALRDAIGDLPGVRIHDLYENYPDFHIDIEHEKAALLEADVIVFQHPMYWYSCPPLMKVWMDDVLEYGFAYGSGGVALRGKTWLQAISTGGPESAYLRQGLHEFTIPELLRPFEKTAYLCGMVPHEPFLIQGTHQLQETEIRAKALEYQRLLTDLRDGREIRSYDTRGEK